MKCFHGLASGRVSSSASALTWHSLAELRLFLSRGGLPVITLSELFSSERAHFSPIMELFKEKGEEVGEMIIRLTELIWRVHYETAKTSTYMYWSLFLLAICMCVYCNVKWKMGPSPSLSFAWIKHNYHTSITISTSFSTVWRMTAALPSSHWFNGTQVENKPLQNVYPKILNF